MSRNASNKAASSISSDAEQTIASVDDISKKAVKSAVDSMMKEVKKEIEKTIKASIEVEITELRKAMKDHFETIETTLETVADKTLKLEIAMDKLPNMDKLQVLENKMNRSRKSHGTHALNFIADITDHLPNFFIICNKTSKLSGEHNCPLIRLFTSENKNNFKKDVSKIK